MMSLRTYCIALLLALILAGCASADMPEPIDIGSDRDALKQSPCACDEILQDYRSWLNLG